MNKDSGLGFIHVIMPNKNTREIDGQKADVMIYLYIDPFLSNTKGEIMNQKVKIAQYLFFCKHQM